MRLLLPMLSVLALGAACNSSLPEEQDNPSLTPIDADGDGFPADVDCDDTDPSIYPGAPDTPYDGIDSDCAGDDDFDVDGDGWRGEGAGGTDCDDLDPQVNPAMKEVCNGKDDDCNGAIDDNPSNPKTFYADVDGDGYGDASSTTTACTVPEGYVSTKTDCDDSLASVHPGAAPVACDGQDNDCDGKLNDEPGGARIGNTDYADVWEAVEAASPGDVVEVCEGEHDSSLEISKSITLRGTATDPRWVTLRGNGGTTLAIDARNVTVENLHITGGSTPQRGGGVHISAAGAVLTNVVVSNNKALEGGGIGLSANGSLSATRVVVEKNTTTGDFNEGGGLYLASGTTLTGTELTLSANSAEIGGGGYIQDGAKLLLDGSSVISGNTSTRSEGGALALETGADISGAIIENNSGGGIWVYYNDTPAGVISDTIVRNHTQNIAQGAGLHLEGPVHLEQVQISGNKASEVGGGLWISYRSTSGIELDTVVVHNNEAPTAGGIWLGEGRLLISSSDFGEGNTANSNGDLVFADGSTAAMSTEITTNCVGDGSTGFCD